ncbi:MAG: HEAT repeat domain-containing protein [Pyrinomonadaceae bacterium]
MQRLRLSILFLAMLAMFSISASVPVFAQGNDRLTPLQRRVEQQKQRLSSSEVEKRRDALLKLSAMKHADASRAAAAALNDPEPIVRVTAAHALTSLPAADAVGLLAPLLRDKLEFVRREVASAMGETRSRLAEPPLLELLGLEKEVSVRAAAVMALGQIGDESVVPALTQILSGISPNKKSKKPEDDFVMRSAAQALGQIRSRAGVSILITTLTNETGPIDVRRAAAEALGLIGDPAATQALQAVVASSDPYLSEAAREALSRIRSAKN